MVNKCIKRSLGNVSIIGEHEIFKERILSNVSLQSFGKLSGRAAVVVLATLILGAALIVGLRSAGVVFAAGRVIVIVSASGKG